MAKKGKRKSKKIPAKHSPEVKGETGPVPEMQILDPKTGVLSKVTGLPPISAKGAPRMVNLRAKIRDLGMLTITVPKPMVDETLEKIWQTGFKQKLNNRQRTHQVYGPHMIDRIDVEPVI